MILNKTKRLIFSDGYNINFVNQHFKEESNEKSLSVYTTCVVFKHEMYNYIQKTDVQTNMTF